MLNQHRILRVLQLITLLQKSPPKSIRNISALLETTERTTYRYLDLIKSVGFYLQKDAHNKYYIAPTSQFTTYDLTKNEIQFMEMLLHAAGKHHKLKDSVLTKLRLQKNESLGGTVLLDAHLGKLIESIEEAIQNGKQICLKNYHSANSNSITDRIVEPIQFTKNYASLIAFELKSNKNKFFHLERISDVKILNHQIRHKELHQVVVPDAFGFSEGSRKFAIHIQMSVKAYVIMKQEYPLALPFIKKQGTNSPTYILQMNVNDFKPITRFVIGLLDEIDVIGSDEFKKHLQQIAERLTASKPLLNKNNK